MYTYYIFLCPILSYAKSPLFYPHSTFSPACKSDKKKEKKEKKKETPAFPTFFQYNAINAINNT